MRLETSDELRARLDRHGWLEAAVVERITPLPASSKAPSCVHVSLCGVLAGEIVSAFPGAEVTWVNAVLTGNAWRAHLAMTFSRSSLRVR